MSNAHILIVEDETGPRKALEMILKPDYEIGLADNGHKALRALESKAYDLVTLDKRLPDMDGLDVLSAIRKKWPAIRVIMITADMSSDIFREALSRGVNHFIVKPFDVGQVQRVVAQQVREKQKEDENARLHREIEGIKQYRYGDLIGQSAPMKKLFETIEQVAKSDTTVLLLGESGTGKELVARAIHNHSARHEGAYIPIHCAAISRELLESELFGYEKGAFTGALTQRIGMFEAADGGSLFLDEIGEMDIGLQAKLLRAIQEREIRRVGGNLAIKVNVRIVSATNRNLETEVKEKRFREDLFYRINVVPIRLPPLRERADDIPLLVRHFTKRFCGELQKPEKQFAPASLELMSRYPWPGNVRELQHCIERLMVIVDAEKILPYHLDPILGSAVPVAATPPVAQLAPAPEGRSLEDMVNEVERKAILQALAESRGVITEAATKLGTTRRVLRYKMDKLGIASDEPDKHDESQPA